MEIALTGLTCEFIPMSYVFYTMSRSTDRVTAMNMEMTLKHVLIPATSNLLCGRGHNGFIS